MTAAQITIDDAFTPQTAPEWFQTHIDNATALKLTTTDWQVGGMARTMVAIAAYTCQEQDVQSSLIAQGGFLDFAATGSISYVDATGQTITLLVTPEGGPGWLDILAESNYAVTRIQLSNAGGQLAITNTSVSTYGPFLAGTYHVTNPTTKQGYSSTADLTIPPSDTVATVSNVLSYFGAIEIVTSGAHGRTTGDIVSVIGVGGIPPLAQPTACSVTVKSSTRFVLDGSTFSGTYTTGGTVYAPTLATVTADVAGSVGNSNNAAGLADTNTVTQPVTSNVGVTVANPVVFLGTDTELNVALRDRCRLKLQSISPNGPGGAYEFFAKSSQQLAPLLGPPQRVGSAITRVRVAQDPPSGAVYVFVGNPAGPVSPEDVTATEAVLHAFCVPDAVTAFVASGVAKDTEVEVTVWLPAAYNTAATRALFQLAIQNYFKVLTIGGVSDPQGSYTNVVPIEAVDGAVFDAAQFARIPIQNLQSMVNGANEDLQLVVNLGTLHADIATLVPAVPTVNLVSI